MADREGESPAADGDRGGYSKTEMEELGRTQALESVGLKIGERRSPRELSGGMRQSAAFARTVLTGSDLFAPR